MKATVIIAFGLSLVLASSCDEFICEPVGKWEAMKWSSLNDGLKYDNQEKGYVVPAQSGEYRFRCKNYSRPWFSSARFQTDSLVVYSYDSIFWEQRDSVSYSPLRKISYDWCAMSINEDTLKVFLDANPGNRRIVGINVTAGDIFYNFRFIQKANDEQ